MIEIRDNYNIPSPVYNEVRGVIPDNDVERYYKFCKENIKRVRQSFVKISKAMLFMFEWDKECAKWQRD